MDLTLLVLRHFVGILFVGHGTQKLFGWFGGSGLDGTAETFEKIGLRPGRLHALAAGMAEAGGGALLALGLLVPFAAAALIGTMTAAIVTVHGRNGVWVTEKGFEYNLVLIAAAFALTGAGPGAWSFDHALSLSMSWPGWALGALAVGLLGGLGVVFSGRRYAQTHRPDPPHHPHPA